MKPNDPKFREFLEKIDPSFRRDRLQKELKGENGEGGMQTLAVSTIADAQAQTRLRERYEAAGLPGEIMEKVKENERIKWALAEHYMAECERLTDKLAEFEKAGLPKDEDEEPTKNGNRATRRRAKAR